MVRSQVGQELRKVDDAQSSAAQESDRVTGRQSDLRDLDFAKAISDMQTNQTQLQAALQVYATVGKTSLFQLLG